MASALQWVPESLYNLALSSYVFKYKRASKEIKELPKNVVFDIYYKLYKQGKLCTLSVELSDLDIFEKVLKVCDKRHLLHHCFQALLDLGSNLAEVLADNYSQRCCTSHCASKLVKNNVISLGHSLGTFLSDSGWYQESDQVLVACLQLCKSMSKPEYLIKSLECCLQLLYVRNCFCDFGGAENTMKEAVNIEKQLIELGYEANFAGLHAEISSFYFRQSQFDKAFTICLKALKMLNEKVSIRTVVDVLRQACKVCIAKRKFDWAEIIIKHAVKLSREHYGSKHPKTSSVLSDYGYYLLNVDNVRQAVQIYQAALNIRQSVFGGCNLLLAMSHEDLAYASYVNEYSIGIFTDAREHAEKAMEIMKQLLPDNHLLFASSKRVNALILEEIALDCNNKEMSQKLLEDAQELHLSALNLTLTAFGEKNVLTAKYYGNLGRLYQSMKKFEEAREMHLKAIKIKEDILGKEDNEVALSVGHLASLYAYDMQLYNEAEELYLRSISIAKKLFGDGYSGLEYDYRGLLNVYYATSEFDKIRTYKQIFEQWKFIREERAASSVSPLSSVLSTLTTEELMKKIREWN